MGAIESQKAANSSEADTSRPENCHLSKHGMRRLRACWLSGRCTSNTAAFAAAASMRTFAGPLEWLVPVHESSVSCALYWNIYEIDHCTVSGRVQRRVCGMTPTTLSLCECVLDCPHADVYYCKLMSRSTNQPPTLSCHLSTLDA